MIHTAEELARIAVELPGWRWLSGMHAQCPIRIYDGTVVGYFYTHVLGCIEDEGALRPMYEVCDGKADFLPKGSLPNLQSPATGGVLLSWLAAKRLAVTATGSHNGWSVSVLGWGGGLAPTLGEACVLRAMRDGEWPNDGGEE